MPVLRDMGKWNNNKDSYHGNTAYYKNEDAVEKVLRYISRTRWNENRVSDLICIGGAGIDISAPIEEIIREFLTIQIFYKIDDRKGRRLIHLTYSFSDDEFNIRLNRNYALVNLIARNISAYYFAMGFQVFYGVHDDATKHTHIHFAISSINYLDGKKYHAGGESFKEMQSVFNQIFEEICAMDKGGNKLCIYQ